MSKRTSDEEAGPSKRTFRGSSPPTILYIAVKEECRSSYDVQHLLAICDIQLVNYTKVGIRFEKYNDYTTIARFNYTPRLNKIKHAFGTFVSCLNFLLINADTDLRKLEIFMQISRKFSFPSSQEVSSFDENDVTPLGAIEGVPSVVIHDK